MKLKIKLLKGGDFELDVDAGSKVRLACRAGTPRDWARFARARVTVTVERGFPVTVTVTRCMRRCRT